MRRKSNLSTEMSVSGWLLSLIVLANLALVGCGTTAPRVVLVPAATWVDGTPETAVKLAEPVEAHVYIKDANDEWVASKNVVTIPEGWWAVAPKPEKKP